MTEKKWGGYVQLRPTYELLIDDMITLLPNDYRIKTKTCQYCYNNWITQSDTCPSCTAPFERSADAKS